MEFKGLGFVGVGSYLSRSTIIHKVEKDSFDVRINIAVQYCSSVQVNQIKYASLNYHQHVKVMRYLADTQEKCARRTCSVHEWRKICSVEDL